MSDEVRSNSSPAPPETGVTASDPGNGPKSLDIEFPAPDLEPESTPDAWPLPEPMPGAVTLLPNKDIQSLPPLSMEPLSMEPLSMEPLSMEPPRSERPPPPSQRLRLDTLATPVPPSSDGATSPAPTASTTLPAPAPLAPAAPPLDDSEDWTPPVTAPGGFPGLAHPVPAKSLGQERARFAPAAPVPDSAPPARMLSEPVPLVVRPGSASPTKGTLRPGLVEPKRIIEVLGSNVPVLDSALEEDAIEDLDDSEAHEVAETPLPDPVSLQPEPELELNVVVEDFPPSIEVAVDEPLTKGLQGGARSAAAAASLDDSVAESVPEGSESESSAADSAAFEGAASEGSASEGEENPPEGVAPPPDPALEASDTPAGQRAKAPPNKRRRPPPPSSRSHEKPKPPEPIVTGARKWWEEMFSEEFLRAIPILSPRQLEREVNFIDEALGVDRRGRILDLACGAGQHAVELATRGYDVVGFDLSQSQLDWAGGLAQERGQRLQFTYGDMRELSYNEAFDGIYSWNTSFGFFEEEKNVDVVQRIFRGLRPGGRFLLDVINRDFVVAQQPGQTWFEGDGCVCIDDVSIDFITSRMKVKRTLMLTNGKNRECNYSVRIYGLHELGKILHDVGFKVLNVSGRPEMANVFFGATSPRIIILATKP
jgi:SAM-dependent methyltransferase